MSFRYGLCLSALLILGLLQVSSGVLVKGSSYFIPDIIVAKDGSGDFTSLNAALFTVPPAVLPANGKVIYVKPGLYNETVIIRGDKRYLTIIGDANQPVFTCTAYGGMVDKNGDPLNTLNSGCFVILADDFTLINIKVVNGAPRPPALSYTNQAVALRATANRTIFYNCSFVSYQDTVYAHKGIQLYKNCYFFGSVDFIFGYARAIFENCTMELNSLGYATVTAQRRHAPWEDNCFVFLGGKVIGSPAPNGQGWLGRAWGQYACTIFAYTFIDSVIYPEGWNDFMATSRHYTTLYAEFNNTGIGANLEGRVEWERTLTASQQAKYLTRDYIQFEKWRRPTPTIPVLKKKP